MDFLIKLEKSNSVIIVSNEAVTQESMDKFYVLMKYLKDKTYFKNKIVISLDYYYVGSLTNTTINKI